VLAVASKLTDLADGDPTPRSWRPSTLQDVVEPSMPIVAVAIVEKTRGLKPRASLLRNSHLLLINSGFEWRLLKHTESSRLPRRPVSSQSELMAREQG